jgi:hypothetical protein
MATDHMIGPCCVTGHAMPGEPQGEMIKIGAEGIDAYVAKAAAGSPPSRGVLLLTGRSTRRILSCVGYVLFVSCRYLRPGRAKL